MSDKAPQCFKDFWMDYNIFYEKGVIGYQEIISTYLTKYNDYMEAYLASNESADIDSLMDLVFDFFEEFFTFSDKHSKEYPAEIKSYCNEGEKNEKSQ